MLDIINVDLDKEAEAELIKFCSEHLLECVEEAEDETETNTNNYATWIAEMDAKLKAAIAEDELDLDDDFYASYKGVVKPRVYFNDVGTENQQTYDELIDNYKPIYPIFE